MSQGKFILKSIGIGLLIYSITGLIIAHILVILPGDGGHAHGMLALLYLFLPFAGAITGIVLGFFMSSMKKIYDVRKVIKHLCIGLPFSLAFFFLWVFLMIE